MRKLKTREMKNKRAITPEHKREIVERLLALWLKQPELRLGQMIYNNIEEPELFYMEDADFIEALDQKTPVG